jgi:hypothetical protein
MEAHPRLLVPPFGQEAILINLEGHWESLVREVETANREVERMSYFYLLQ